MPWALFHKTSQALTFLKFHLAQNFQYKVLIVHVFDKPTQETIATKGETVQSGTPRPQKFPTHGVGQYRSISNSKQHINDQW